MHKSDEEAIDTIDAMVFNGDALFDDATRTEFREMLARWERQLIEIDKTRHGQPFNDALNYALDNCDGWGREFLLAWREGDWELIQQEWPDFGIDSSLMGS
jgi:hypothetical protein